jgi:hypothetical protein
MKSKRLVSAFLLAFSLALTVWIVRPQPVRAQADSCGYIDSVILSLGGVREIDFVSTYASVSWVGITVYFPSVGVWWYASCYIYH